MKKLVTTYTFDASMQTVDSADFTTIEQILLITNLVDGIIIYNFADPAKIGTLAGTTLTLTYNTSLMSDTDELQIWIDDELQAALESGGNLAASAASLAILDNIVAGSEAQVDVVTSALPTGAATSANQTTANGLLTTIDADTSALAGTVAGSELQVDVVTLPAITGTVTANAGTNLNTSALALESGGNLATLAGTVSSARAAVNPISGQAGVQGGSGTVSALTQRVVLATDVALPTGTNSIGSVTDGGSGKTLKRAVVSLTGDGDVVAAVATKRIKVYNYELQSLNDSMVVQFKSNNGAGTALGIPWNSNAREGALNAGVNPPAFIFATVAGEALYADLTGTGTVNIAVSYWDDDTA